MVAWQTLKHENERRQKLSESTSGFCMLRVQRFLRSGLPRRLRSQMNKLNRRVASYESCRASRCTQVTYESTLSPTHLMQQLLAFVHPLLKSTKQRNQLPNKGINHQTEKSTSKQMNQRGQKGGLASFVPGVFHLGRVDSMNPSGVPGLLRDAGSCGERLGRPRAGGGVAGGQLPPGRGGESEPGMGGVGGTERLPAPTQTKG